jgi:hypothetical protein
MGIVILGAWFTEYWPASSWRVLPQAQLLANGRDVTKHFGLNTSDSNAYLVASVAQPLVHYSQQHPADVNARTVSPLSVRITFVAKQNGQKAEVGLDSTGLPVYWRAPDRFKPANPAVSEREAANQAFGFLAGADAGSFSNASKSMGDDPDQEEYVWKKATPSHSDLRERISILTQNAIVKRAERKLYVSSDDDPDSDTGDTEAYWGVLRGVFWLFCTAGTVSVLSIYLLWLVRRSVSHKFPILIAIAALVTMIAALLAGSSAQKAHSVDGDSDWPMLFAAVEVMCFVAVGRGISAVARPKWMSLEQLCRLAPVAKATGESLAAGVLCSPLLVAIPFLIVGCGLFRQSSVVARNLEILYSPAPLLDSLNVVPKYLYLLGFFGFAIPALERMIRSRWLRLLIALAIGTLFFANVSRAVTGPLAAALTLGFCILALFWFLYKYFDLLAVLTLQLTSGLVLSMLTLGQKGSAIWPFLVTLLGLLVIAVWFAWHGQSVSEGDPRATTPALAGFRAEREKLQAEFSVARRAQQGMLPQSPPHIPGYSIAASCTPSLDVGGDLYDFLKLPDGRIGIGVADVSGKGVPAALYMTLTKGLLASVSKDNSELASVVEEVNRHLHGVTRKKVFVTMALGFLDAEKRVLQCVRAGHNPMVWRQASQHRTTLVSPGGLGLGITASRIFSNQLKMEQMSLSEGDAVVFYSDGITEAMNSSLEQFGEQRLMQVVETTDQMDAAATRDSILAAVREFLDGVHPQDDMTLVVLRVGDSGSTQNHEDERMMVSG